MMLEHYHIRPAQPDDHTSIIQALPEWWGGRDLTAMVPRVFLQHFHATSLIIEFKEQLAGFLIGFNSQSYRDEAYIHFAGIHPEHRGLGIGKYLYLRFFQRCQKMNRNIIRACTSPVNKGSIQFHQKIGFQMEEGEAQIDDVPVFLDYNKPGDHKVRFLIDLSNPLPI